MINYGLRVSLTADIPESAREWRNIPDIWRWCRQHTLISKQEQDNWLKKIIVDNTKMFGILDEKEQDIGVCGLTSINQLNQNAEFSLYIAHPHQGEGYGKEALATLLKHGFSDFNLNRIWGETYEGNKALNMFKSLGLKEEGVLRESYFRNGKFIHTIITSMLRSESAVLDTYISNNS